MNTDKVIDDAREKIAQKLASMDNWRFDDLKEHSTSFNEGAPTKDHYIRRANEVLAISGTTDIECPECGGEAVFENINTGGFVSGIICSKCNGTGVIKEPWEMGVHLKNGELPDKISHAGHGVTTLELCEFIQQDMLDAGYVQKVGD